MHKLVIAIEQPDDEEAFDRSWPSFLKVAEQMPGLRRESTSRVYKTVYGKYPYTLIHELYFDSLDAIQQAMSSAEGREAGRLLQSMTQGKISLAFADHKEDDLENIARYRGGSRDE